MRRHDDHWLQSLEALSSSSWPRARPRDDQRDGSGRATRGATERERTGRGSIAVEEALAAEASIGAVNLAEVLSKLVDADQDPDEAMGRIGFLPLEVVPFDDTLAVGTARLRPPTVRARLSLGDRACLALAQSRTERVLTTDAAWEDLIPTVGVVLIAEATRTSSQEIPSARRWAPSKEWIWVLPVPQRSRERLRNDAECCETSSTQIRCSEGALGCFPR